MNGDDIVLLAVVVGWVLPIVIPIIIAIAKISSE
jgi:uncharacterized membrane protein YbjE (DUF340 family)